MMWWSGLGLTELLIGIAVRVFIVLICLPIHEFAHGFAAYKLGDPTAKNNGRLTLNPIAHIDWIGAACIMLVGFGWAKPVPVNPFHFKNQKHRKAGMALTAFAGPLSNLLFAFLGVLVLRGFACARFLPENVNLIYYATYILFYVIAINLSLAIFNLIPIPPLDGSRIIAGVLPDKVSRFFEKYQMVISLVFIVVIFGGLLDGPLSFLQHKAIGGLYGAADWIYNIIGLEGNWNEPIKIMIGLY